MDSAQTTTFNSLAKRALKYLTAPFADTNTQRLMHLLRKSADACDVEQALSLIKRGIHPDQLHNHLEENFAPLHYVAIRGHDKRIAEALLKAGATVDIVDPKLKKTPLFLAAKYSNAEIAQVLLDAGADINYNDADGRTPIGQAIEMDKGSLDNIATITLLLDRGAAIDDDDYFSALSQPKTLALLLQREVNIDIVNTRDIEGTTLLHFAATLGHDESLRLLLTREFDLEARNKGDTALTAAGEHPQPQTMKILLDAGADPFAKNDQGLTCRDLLKTGEWPDEPEKQAEALKMLDAAEAVWQTRQNEKIRDVFSQQLQTSTTPPPPMRLTRKPRP